MKLLPIGSVVTLEEATKKIMITGILVSDEGSRKTYDYIGVPFPEGFISNETMLLFMHENIGQINFLGYVNAEVQGFRALVKKRLEAEEESEPV